MDEGTKVIDYTGPLGSQEQRTVIYGVPTVCQALHITLRILFLKGRNCHFHFPNKEIEMQRINLPKVTQLGFQPKGACCKRPLS